MELRRLLFCLTLSVFAFGFVFPGFACAQTWVQMNTDGFGDANNQVIFDFFVYDNRLYATTRNDATGGEVWRYNGATWLQANADGFGEKENYVAGRMTVWNSLLYVGTANRSTGGQVWRYDGTAWSKINTGGFGDTNNSAVSDLIVYRGSLYASTGNGATGGEIWRYNGATWSQVSAGGFGDARNTYAYRMKVYEDCLYVGTFNGVTGAEVWQYDGKTWTQMYKDASFPLVSGFGVYSAELYVGLGESSDNIGCEVWRYDKISWSKVSGGGFGDVNNNSMYAMPVFNNKLYGGTRNLVAGGQVWEYDGTLWKKANTDGFGDSGNISVFCLAVYNGSLYAGSSNGTSGAEVWRLCTLYVNKDDITCSGNSPCYASIQEAIEAAGNGCEILIAQGVYNEAPELNESKAVTLKGGWDSSYTSQTSNGTIIKAPKAPQGTVTLQMLTVRP